MEFVELQGARVPKLGLGTWQLGGQACRDAVRQGLELGYRHIDTAQMYENEAEVGAELRASGLPRDEVWITTKLGLEQVSYDDALKSAHNSLKRLAADYIDLLLIHWPSKQVPLEETLRAMVKLQEEKTVRYIGVSNFPPRMVERALPSAPIFAVQAEYHPFLSQKQLLDQCRKRKLMFTAYSPLARGKVSDEDVLKRIASTHDKTPHQVALRWLIQQTNVTAIPKASSRDHLRANIDIFDFQLSDAEMKEIDSLERGERLIDPSFAPEW